MKIDLHCHTVFSGDSLLTPAELFARAREEGMDAVAITEHRSFEASRPAVETAREMGFTLFRGVEVSTDHGHFQLFGVTDDSWNLWGSAPYPPAREVVARAVELGAVVIAAHPYGRRDLHGAFDDILTFEGLTALESSNGRSRRGEDELTEKAAALMGVPHTGGSDCHRADEVANCYTLFERPVSTMAQFMEELRAGRVSPVRRRWRA